MLKIINGYLLEAKEKYIAHQANAVTNYCSGLAFYIFEKYPYSDIYKNRFLADEPGSIKICGNGEEQRYVINMIAQYDPGPPKFQGRDTKENREKYFQQCLDQISKIENLESIAFPYLIGCGLAKGIWNNYLEMLTNFEDQLNNVDVVIYKKD